MDASRTNHQTLPRQVLPNTSQRLYLQRKKNVQNHSTNQHATTPWYRLFQKPRTAPISFIWRRPNPIFLATWTLHLLWVPLPIFVQYMSEHPRQSTPKPPFPECLASKSTSASRISRRFYPLVRAGIGGYHPTLAERTFLLSY